MRKPLLLVAAALLLCGCFGHNDKELNELAAYADTLEQHVMSYNDSELVAAREHLDSLTRAIANLRLSDKEISRFGSLEGRCSRVMVRRLEKYRKDQRGRHSSYETEMLRAADAMADSLQMIRPLPR